MSIVLLFIIGAVFLVRVRLTEEPAAPAAEHG
jgi:hypothetical protein